MINDLNAKLLLPTGPTDNTTRGWPYNNIVYQRMFSCYFPMNTRVGNPGLKFGNAFRSKRTEFSPNLQGTRGFRNLTRLIKNSAAQIQAKLLPAVLQR